jgi:hypothetical protein
MVRQNCVDERGNAAGRDTSSDTRSEGRVGRRAQLTGEIIDVPRRGTSGPRLRPVGGQTHMPEDSVHDARVLDQREQPQPAATAWAVEHVDPKRPPHQLVRYVYEHPRSAV